MKTKRWNVNWKNVGQLKVFQSNLLLQTASINVSEFENNIKFNGETSIKPYAPDLFDNHYLPARRLESLIGKLSKNIEMKNYFGL